MVTAPSTSEDLDISLFKVGERLLYTNEGHTTMVSLREIKKTKGATQFLVELSRNKFILTTCDLLRPPTQPDIVIVPVSREDFKDKVGNFSAEHLEKLAHPQPLSPEQQKMMDYHVRLGHLPFLSFIVLPR